jgi:2-polyprenyl-3-methyl-5-hydroxy-6-metoxy-1,4-benzoquinol methylase
MDNKMTFNALNGVDIPLPLFDIDHISKIVADTYDHIVEVYTQKHTGGFVLSKPLDAFAYLLRKHNKHTILDIGCGPGWEVSFLMAHGFDVLGIDASQEMIHKAAEFMPMAKFYVMPLQRLTFPEASFDAIWCARTLIHVPKALVTDILVTWKRQLQSSGIIGVSVIIGSRDGWGPEDYAPEKYMFNHFFAEGELEAKLVVAGFEVLSSQIIKDQRDPENPDNLFVFAKKSDQ